MTFGMRLLLLVCLVSFPTTLFAGEIGINIYGISYHPERRDSNGRKFDELNPGVGINYIALEKSKSIFQVNAGIFKNSGGEAAQYIGGGYCYKIGKGFSAGGELVYFHSSSYNNGNSTLGIVPMASYRRNSLSFTLLYLPKYKNINRNMAFGFYGTIHLKNWK
jgi:hypothetical protein